MNIDQMSPGREMDALLAAKVMGLLWDETRCRICGWPSFKDITAGCTKESCSLRPAPERRADEPAPWSTDIATTWKMVEALEVKGCLLLRVGKEFGEGQWLAQFAKGKTYGGCFEHARGDTATLAICRAALKTVL
jgi:hypothetical protein